MKTIRVLILLSSYNGEKYIEEQIKSIIAQENVEWYLLVRDDGSTDTTPKILKKYKSKYPDRIEYIIGRNIGYAASFVELVHYALNTDLYAKIKWFAFSDQDDVWHSNKISHAIEFIEGDINTNKPILYCSNTELVDQNLNHIGYSWNPDKVKITKERCLIESFATGCTMCFNRRLAELFVSRYDPSYPAAHDFFMYQLAVFLGRCYWDSESFIKYRQHGNNCIGKINVWSKIKRKILKRVKRKNGILEMQARSFLDLNKDILQSSDKLILANFINYRLNGLNKIKLICNRKYRYQSDYMTYMLWIRILRGVL